MLWCMTDIDRAGRQRIADLVHAVMGWHGLSVPVVAAKPGRPGNTTIERIRRADEDVSDVMLRALGGKLGLPPDFLLYVGYGDARRVAASGGDPDLIRWTIDLIEADRPPRERSATG